MHCTVDSAAEVYYSTTTIPLVSSLSLLLNGHLHRLIVCRTTMFLICQLAIDSQLGQQSWHTIQPCPFIAMFTFCSIFSFCSSCRSTLCTHKVTVYTSIIFSFTYIKGQCWHYHFHFILVFFLFLTQLQYLFALIFYTRKRERLTQTHWTKVDGRRLHHFWIKANDLNRFLLTYCIPIERQVVKCFTRSLVN